MPWYGRCWSGEAFFASNPGMSSRIAHHLEFPDYSLAELVAIGGLEPADFLASRVFSG